jgi:hypothetical protein
VGGVGLEMYFDPATSQLLQAGGVFRGQVDTPTVYTDQQGVDSVPQTVLDCIAQRPPAPTK